MLKWFVFILICLSQSSLSAQNFEWGHASDTLGNGESIATDIAGNSYYSSSPLTKYSPQGKLVWKRSFFRSTNYADAASVATDKNCNIYVCGSFVHSIKFTSTDSLNDTSNKSMYIAKYDSAGNFKWAKIGASGGIFGGTKSAVILIDRLNNIYVKGVFINNTGGIQSSSSTIFGSQKAVSLNGYFSYVVKYDSTGKYTWVNYQKDVAAGAGWAIACVDSFANIYFESVNQGVFKLDSSGNFLWLNNFNIDDYAKGAIHGICCFPNGNFYIVGEMDSMGSYGAFIAFYSSDGIRKWIRIARYSGQAIGIALHRQYAYWGGTFGNPMRLGNKKLDNSGDRNALFISKIDSSGNFLWAFGSGQKNGSDYVNYITTDTAGNTFFTGTMTGTITFGKFALKGSAYTPLAVKISDVSLWRDKIKKTQYCTGDSILVPYHVSGIIGPGNTFHAELSDSNGSFDSIYYPIGKLTTQGNGIIHCKLPSNLAYSSRYNIHVYSDTPNVTSYYNPQTITIYPYPIVKVKYDTFVCYGKTDTLHASGGSSYEWIPSTGLSNSKIADPVFKADTTRSYLIIASNPAGCSDTAKITIKVSPKIYLKTSNDTILCPGASVTLSVTEVKGGQDTNYTYAWYLGNSIISTSASVKVSSSKTTSYKVIVSDGCGIVNKFITVRIFSPLKVFAGKDQGICPGHPNHLTANATGGDSTKYVFTWDNGLGTGRSKAVTPLNTTTYRIIIQDTGSCPQKADTGYVTVYRTNPMKLSLSHDTTICYGASSTITSHGTGGDSLRYIYSWDTGGTIISHNAITSVVPIQSTKYRCILTDSCSLHSDTAFIKVNVSAPLKLILPKDTVVCLGQSAMLSIVKALGGVGDTSKYIYQWDTGGIVISHSKTVSLTPSLSFKYRCILNDGCSSPDTDYVGVTVRTKLSVKANDVSACAGDSVKLIAQGTGGDSLNYRYKWNNGHIGATLSVALDSTKQFIVVLKDGCSVDSATAKATVIVNPHPKSILNISPQELEIRTGEIYFTALNTDADSFLWLFGDSTSGKGKNQIHSYQMDGTFSPRLVSTNQYGCRDTAKGEVVILPQLQVYFPNVFTPDGDSLNETWMPIGVGISRISISIYDRWGGHVFKSETPTKGWNGNILNSNDPAIPGVYPYIVNFWDYNGNKHTKTGTILLLITSKY